MSRSAQIRKIDKPLESSALLAQWAPKGDMSLEELKISLTPVLKSAMEAKREEIARRFTEKPNGSRAIQEASFWIDELLTTIMKLACDVAAVSEDALALVAVGGYGRGEIFPYSDVDLLFLYDQNAQVQAEEIAQTLLYILWDLKLTVGYAVRSTEETLQKAHEDITICTALLDMRFITGSARLYEAMEARFWSEVVEGTETRFVEAKLAERDQRHRRVGDSRYVLEPNIKEGKGSLRDLHNLYWLARYCYHIESVEELVKMGLLTEDEFKDFKQAKDFLHTLRMHLHLVSGRAEERLTFDKQREVARRMGAKEDDEIAAVTRFMKRYYLVAKTVGNLTRIFCALLEEEKKRKPRLSLAGILQRTKTLQGFILDGERLTVESEDVFTHDPVKLIELFQVSQAHDLDIHPRALQFVSRNLHRIDSELMKDARANALFMDILLCKKYNPEITLRRMNEAGVLGRFIRDFGHVIGQMQFDMYHNYTVDEHTLFAIGILHNVEHGRYPEDLPVSTRIVKLVESRHVLYLALLCHDIAKGRGGDHSMLGEKVAMRLSARFGFTPNERETAAWLVRWHLLFSHTAFKRDINDPQTIRKFVDQVQSLERLRLLLVLTVADIRAVGPNVWNGWKGALLRDLYLRAEEMMGGSEKNAIQHQRAELEAELKKQLTGWPEEEVMAYLELGHPSFWTGCDAPTHARIARMLREAEKLQQDVQIDTRSDHFRANTEIVVCTPDRQGLFSKLAGVMALAGANIVGAKIFTLKNGMAVDIFQVQDMQAQAFDKPDKLAKLSVLMEKALFTGMNIEKELTAQKRTWPSRYDSFKIPAAVFIENTISSAHTVLEVNGKDRPGLLFAVTKALADLNLTIATAHISTYGQRVVDVFYLKDIFGMKIHHDGKLKQIREKVMAVL